MPKKASPSRPAVNHPSTDILPICRICQAKPCADHYTFTCEGCKPLSHICCTSVGDGIRAAKSATLEDLERAFEFECKKNGRKTLLTAILRQISKLKKAGGAQ